MYIMTTNNILKIRYKLQKSTVIYTEVSYLCMNIKSGNLINQVKTISNNKTMSLNELCLAEFGYTYYVQYI